MSYDNNKGNEKVRKEISNNYFCNKKNATLKVVLLFKFKFLNRKSVELNFNFDGKRSNYIFNKQSIRTKVLLA